MAAPERRKTTPIQFIALAVNVGLLTAVAGLAFRSGQVEQQVQDLRTQMAKQSEAYNAA
jgi:hypothetical protein